MLMCVNLQSEHQTRLFTDLGQYQTGVKTRFYLKVPYYTHSHQYIIGLRYIQNMSLKCLAQNTKQIVHCKPLCFSPVSVSVSLNANELLLATPL